MKKNDLKRSLDRIRPREELVTATLSRIHERQETKKAPVFSPLYNRGLRLAGAVCAIALVIGLGFALLRNEEPAVGPTPATRTLAELHTTDTETVGNSPTTFAFDEAAPNGWIVISGQTDSFAFMPVSEEDTANGITHKAAVRFSAERMLERSDDLKVDLEKVSVTLAFEVRFGSEEAANAFAEATCNGLLLKLTPDDNGGWSLLDYAPAE